MFRRFLSRARALAACGACALLLPPAAAIAQTGLQFDGVNDYVTFGPATPQLGASRFLRRLVVIR